MTSNPRVFIADDNHTSFDTFLGLAESKSWIIAGYAADYDSFINRARQSDADVMLISSGFLGVMSAGQRRALKEGNPERVILAITDTEDFAELKAAVRAGARDCVSANDPENLIASIVYEYFAESAAIRDSIENRAFFDEEPVCSAAGGKVIAFCGADGGTGKSFLALQAAGMAVIHAGAKTCLIDFDLRCGALSTVIAAQVPGERTLGDLTEVIDEIRPFQIESLLRSHSGGFSVICGPAPEIAAGQDLIGRIIEPLRSKFDAVILDFPPNPNSVFPMNGIDIFYIVMTPDTASAACARRLALEITAVCEHVDIAGIVNRSDRPGGLKLTELKRLSGIEVAAEVPEDEGAGRLFETGGRVLAGNTNLSLIKGLVPVVQRIKDFDALIRPNRLAHFKEWRPPWLATPKA